MNVLIIPSWYPVDDNKHGQFFRNEAFLISKKFHVTLIFISLSYVRRRSLKSVIKFLFSFERTKYQKFSDGNFVEIISKVELWPNRKGKFPIAEVTNIFQTIMQREKRSFDLIHAHSTLFGGVIAMNLSRFLKIPYIITEHQHMPFLLGERDNSFELFNALNGASIVLAVSKYQRQQLLSFRVDNDIDVIGNYINESVFKFKDGSSQNQIFTILYVAYDGYIKDFQTFITAICLLQYQIPQFQINIITSFNNNQINDLLSRIDNSKIKVNVFFGIDNKKMPLYYLNSSVFVSTSIAETFGVSHVESLFCGIPVVSTDSGGVMDFLNTQNSLILEIKDSEAIAQAIMKIYCEEVIFNPEHLRQSVFQKYSSEFFLESISTIYQKVLNQTNYEN
jgi:glycosyltransferase involved in cell wall biosynthesis